MCCRKHNQLSAKHDRIMRFLSTRRDILIVRVVLTSRAARWHSKSFTTESVPLIACALEHN